MIDRLARHFEQQYATDLRSLAFARIAYCIYVLVFQFPLAGKVVGMPQDAFRPPPGLPSQFPGVPGPGSVTALNAIILILLAMVLVGWRTRLASLLLGLALIVGYSMDFTVGKINHTTTLVLIPLAMSLSAWGAHFSIDARQYRALHTEQLQRVKLSSAWALSLLALGMALAFFSAGAMKAFNGWLDPNTSAVLGHGLRGIYVSNREPLLFMTFYEVLPLWMWEAKDWATLALDFGLIIAIFNRALLRFLMSCAVFFHVGVMLLMAITFSSTLVGYACFVGWASLLCSDQTGSQPEPDRRKSGYAAALVLLLAAGITGILTGKTLSHLYSRDGTEAVLITAAALFVLGWWGRSLVQLLKPKPPSAVN
ncbi:MAG: hypothetical protein AAGB26_02055 [Planctomycetota bacterium]